MAFKRTKIPQLEKLMQCGRKKFVRYEEGAQLYSMGLHSFQDSAHRAGENTVDALSLFLAAGVRVFIKVQRQAGHCFRQDADAGISRCHLHGRAFVHPLAAGAPTEKEAVAAAVGAVAYRMVPRPEQAAEYAHSITVLL